MPADRQAQTRSPIAARDRALRLHEAFEDRLQSVRLDADAGIAHGELQRHLASIAGVHPHRHDHLTALGELQRVAPQVKQHLPQAKRIAAHHAGHRRVEVEQHLDAIVLLCCRQHDRQLLHQQIQLHGRFLDQQLAGLRLGEIEDVSED